MSRGSVPATDEQHPKAGLRVLSTLNEDGTRRWIRPRVSRGRFLTARRIVGYILILVFTAIPYTTVNGKPTILLNVMERKFTLFGYTFLPTDTVLLALLLVSVFVGIFLVTALFGRVWCGWACPQTVYMELLYRPIERFFDGAPGRRAKVWQRTGAARLAKLAVFFLCSLYLAHTFLAYFVGKDALLEWVGRSPLEHPRSFIVMAAVTGLMMFDFCFFREQVCLVACPYGRFQAALLDRDSLIVSYDPRRGEPRGKIRRSPDRERGDCVDCGLCVTTCPTGIDIRDGLQMECIGCAQCIDACDAVMPKINRPRGLIRYTSQAVIEGRARRLIRPRVMIYPVILIALLGLFGFAVGTKSPADVTVLRSVGLPFQVLSDGMVANQVRVKIVNRTGRPRTYALSVGGDPSLRLEAYDGPVTLAPGEDGVLPVQVVAARGAFNDGSLTITLGVTDGEEFRKSIRHRLLGPRRVRRPGGSEAGGR